jgi:hypothetical protein
VVRLELNQDVFSTERPHHAFLEQGKKSICSQNDSGSARARLSHTNFFENYGADRFVDFLPTVDMKQPRPRSTQYALSYQRLSELTGKSLSASNRRVRCLAGDLRSARSCYVQ